MVGSRSFHLAVEKPYSSCTRISGKFKELPEMRQENSKNYLRCDNSSIKETLCSAKPGCQVAQLVKSLATSGYPDGSMSGKWKDSHPAVVKRDCPEINSSQFVKTPMWFGATETWTAAGLLPLARRKTTLCDNDGLVQLE